MVTLPPIPRDLIDENHKWREWFEKVFKAITELQGGNVPLSVQYADTPQLDAFGRLRVASPFGIFDSKQISTNDSYAWNEIVSGSGASATYQYDRSSTYLTVGTVSGERVVRQTARYFPYVPGKSHLIQVTGKLGTGKTNVDQYVGYGDDLNGLFFKLQGTTLGVVTRTSTSGTAVDTFVAQSDWNLDRLDGTGPSRITLDPTKVQIFMIDFQWLGVGRVRFGFVIDGVEVLCHEINHANTDTVVYMTTPTLPIRYEIRNTGTSASSTTLEQICSSVSSEGGYEVPGMEFSVGNGITRNAVTAREPILLIRLKNAFPVGKPNRRQVRFIDLQCSTVTNNAFFELVHIHNPTVTATWNDVDTDSSGVEYATTITSVTGAHTHVIQALTVMAGQAGKGGTGSINSEFIDAHSYISQNIDSTNSDLFAVYATSETGTADCACHITWIESE